MKNNIKIIAQARGIQLKELRKYVNLSQSTFSLLVNGKRNLDIVTLDKLCDILQCSRSQILGEESVDNIIHNSYIGKIKENNVSLLRMKNEMSQKDIAQELGITAAMLSMIENRKISIPKKIQLQLASIFDCNINDLFISEVEKNIESIGNDNVDDNIESKDNNENYYIDIALEILDEIEEEKGIDIPREDKVEIVKQIYDLIKKINNNKYSKIELIKSFDQNSEKVIIEGVNIPKLLISKLK
jgi:transcriptional regulator with XRE-family HTH domain